MGGCALRKNKGMMNSQQAKENFDRYSVYLGFGDDVLLEDDFIALVGEDLAEFVKNQEEEKGLCYKVPAPWGETLTMYTFKGYLRAIKLINIIKAELYEGKEEIHDNGEIEEEPPAPDNVIILQRSGKSNGKES